MRGAAATVEVVALPLPRGASRREQRAVVHAHLAATVGPVTHLCPRCGSAEHGRPLVPGRHLSLSYAEGLALVALADRPVGVDVEADGPALEGYADRRAWTRAEALLKVSGEGLHGDPAAVEAWSTALALPAPYLGTVALLGREPAVVVLSAGRAAAPRR